jgi:hypothetical protein
MLPSQSILGVSTPSAMLLQIPPLPDEYGEYAWALLYGSSTHSGHGGVLHLEQELDCRATRVGRRTWNKLEGPGYSILAR